MGTFETTIVSEVKEERAFLEERIRDTLQSFQIPNRVKKEKNFSKITDADLLIHLVRNSEDFLKHKEYKIKYPNTPTYIVNINNADSDFYREAINARYDGIVNLSKNNLIKCILDASTINKIPEIESKDNIHILFGISSTGKNEIRDFLLRKFNDMKPVTKYELNSTAYYANEHHSDIKLDTNYTPLPEDIIWHRPTFEGGKTTLAIKVNELIKSLRKGTDLIITTGKIDMVIKLQDKFKNSVKVHAIAIDPKRKDYWNQLRSSIAQDGRNNKKLWTMNTELYEASLKNKLYIPIYHKVYNRSKFEFKGIMIEKLYINRTFFDVASELTEDIYNIRTE